MAEFGSWSMVKYCTTCGEKTKHNTSPKGLICGECRTILGPGYFDHSGESEYDKEANEIIQEMKGEADEPVN